MKDKNKRKKIAKKRILYLKTRMSKENKPPIKKTNGKGDWVYI